MTPRFITPRLTAPQIAVLRALDDLPEGEWTTAKDGGFSGNAAGWLAVVFADSQSRPVRAGHGKGRGRYALTPAGRALVARLKAEGAL